MLDYLDIDMRLSDQDRALRDAVAHSKEPLRDVYQGRSCAPLVSRGRVLGTYAPADLVSRVRGLGVKAPDSVSWCLATLRADSVHYVLL